MNKINTLFLVSVSFLSVIEIACKNSNNAVGSVQTPSFTFQVGSNFQFQQWKLDQNGNRIDSTLQYIHETFIDSMFSIGGFHNAYVVLDSTFDSTNSTFILSDSVYYTTSGSEISEFKLLSTILNTYAPGKFSDIPIKWNLLMDAGNTNGWLMDTSSFTLPLGTYTANITDTLDGKYLYDTTIVLHGDTIRADHAVLIGPLWANTITSTQAQILIYIAENPAVIVKWIVEPIQSQSIGLAFPGLERDLDKIVRHEKPEEIGKHYDIGMCAFFDFNFHDRLEWQIP